MREIYKSFQLTLQQILDPAINLGQNGFPVSQMTSGAWQRSITLNLILNFIL